MNALYVPFVHAFILKSCTGFSFRHFRYKRLYSYRLSESNIHDVPFRVDTDAETGRSQIQLTVYVKNYGSDKIWVRIRPIVLG